MTTEPTADGGAGADALAGKTGEGTDADQNADGQANGAGAGGQDGAGGQPGEGSGSGSAAEFFKGIEGDRLELIQRKGWDKAEKFGRDELLDEVMALEKLKGADVVEKPRLDDAEKRAEWFRQNGGAHAEAKGYQEAVKRPELPEGMEYDTALEAKAFEVAAKAGIPAFAVQELYGVFAAHMAEQFTTEQGNAKEAEAAFERAAAGEWGGEKAKNIQIAGEAAKDLARDILGIEGEAAEAFFNKLNGAMGDFGVVKFFRGLADKMGNDALTGGGNSGFGNAPAQAQAELARLSTDQDFKDALYNASAAGHKDAVARWQRLHEQAFPSGRGGSAA